MASKKDSGASVLGVVQAKGRFIACVSAIAKME